MKKIIAIGLLCALCQLPKPAEAAADMAALESQVRELTAIVNSLKLTVDAQSREIATLKGQAVEPTPPSQPTAAAGQRSLQGRWNPDIGVIADVVGRLDSAGTQDAEPDAEGADRVSVRELELVFGSAVDPHSRLDATIAIADFETMSLEEAYYTHFGLPLGSTARLGRFKPMIGKAIPMHRDSLDTVDEPLVIQRYFGHHGYNKTGIDLKLPVPLPTGWTHEAAAGLLEGGNGEEGTLFSDDARRRPTAYAHLKNYVDLNDAAGLELGASYLTGSRDADAEFEVYVLGTDATLIHRYADRRHVKLQGEAFRVSRTESFVNTEADDGGIHENDLDSNRNLWGGYALFDWRFMPEWAAGFRYDQVQLIDDAVDSIENAERGYTGYLTFYQSEFARWRLQYSHTDLVDGDVNNEIMLQGTFAIGEHKHKLT